MDDPVRLPQPIYIVSDGTGDTAEKVVRAALRQFRGHIVHLRTFPQVTRPEQLTQLMRRASRQSAMVVTTLVRREMRDLVERLSTDLGVRHIDLLGSLIGEMQGFLNQTAAGVPGLLRQAD